MVNGKISGIGTIIQDITRIAIHHRTCTLTYAVSLINRNPLLLAVDTTREILVERILEQRHVVSGDSELIWLTIDNATAGVNTHCNLVCAGKWQLQFDLFALSTSVRMRPVDGVTIIEQTRQCDGILIIDRYSEGFTLNELVGRNVFLIQPVIIG